MDNLAAVDKNTSFKILSRLAAGGIEVTFKEQDSTKILKTTLFKNSARKQFYIENKTVELSEDKPVTFKIIIDLKLYFLKTTVKKSTLQFYFDNFENMYELIRRRKPRYLIPDHWAQSAHIQGSDKAMGLKAPATILDLSRSGMRLHVRTDIPRYEVGQTVTLFFKVYRRAEITVKSKIIYLNKSGHGGGAVMGLEYADSSILITNKIQNVCDDLAFHWTSETELHK